MAETSSQARVFILSAPSGGGKSSLARALADSAEDVVTSVSHTTRAIRPGEVDGRDYFFVDDQTFKAMIAADEFVEHAHVFGKRYGTSRAAIAESLAAGKSVVLDIDWQGAQQVRAAFNEAISVYIFPPSLEDLAARLRARGRETEEQVGARLAEAASEMAHYGEYDYLMVNADFDQALSELKGLIFNGKMPSSAAGFDVEALVQNAKSVRLKT